MSNLVIPRESKEYLPITVKRKGVIVTTGVESTVTNEPTRPTAGWVSAPTVDGGLAHLLQPVATQGWYDLWVRVTDGSEIAVERLGRIWRS